MIVVFFYKKNYFLRDGRKYIHYRLITIQDVCVQAKKSRLSFKIYERLMLLGNTVYTLFKYYYCCYGVEYEKYEEIKKTNSWSIQNIFQWNMHWMHVVWLEMLMPKIWKKILLRRKWPRVVLTHDAVWSCMGIWNETQSFWNQTK